MMSANYVPAKLYDEWQPYIMDFERAQSSGTVVSVKMDAYTTIHFVPSKKRPKLGAVNAVLQSSSSLSSSPPRQSQRRVRPIRHGSPGATVAASKIAASAASASASCSAVEEKMEQIYATLDETVYTDYVDKTLDEIESDSLTMSADEKRRIIDVHDRIQQKWTRLIAEKNASANSALASKLKDNEF
jgi:hypothetical protein